MPLTGTVNSKVKTDSLGKQRVVLPGKLVASCSPWAGGIWGTLIQEDKQMKDLKAKPLTPETKWLRQSYPAELRGEHSHQGAPKPDGYVF